MLYLLYSIMLSRASMPGCDQRSVVDEIKDAVVTEIAKGEGDRLDFKGAFDPSLTGDWCELIKDIIAMAKSGGGCVIVGLNDDGKPSGDNVAAFLALDAADVGNKIHKYTGHHFSDF